MPSLKDAHLSLDEVKLVLKACGVDESKIDAFLPKGDETQVVTIERRDFVRQKIGSVKRTDEGYLTGIAPIAKVGVMSYYLGKGQTRREYLPPETLFAPAAMDSLKLKPITDSHPDKMLDAQTAKVGKIGFTGETVSRSDSFLTTSLVITDSDAIKHVDSGRRQLSPGYVCHLLMQGGEIDGEKYDAIQIGRRYNHVAICDVARGGAELSLNLDSLDGTNASELRLTNKKLPTLTRKELVMTYKIDGIEYEAAPEVVNHIARLDSKMVEMSGKVDATKLEMDKVKGERDQLKAKVDTLEKRDIRADVAERLSIETIARKVIDAKELDNALKLDNAGLKVAVVKAKSPNVNLDGKSAEYVNGHFDVIAETVKVDKAPEGSAIDRQRQVSAPRTDGSSVVDLEEKARKDMVERMSNGWKPEVKK
jgi:hypothetical protein